MTIGGVLLVSANDRSLESNILIVAGNWREGKESWREAGFVKGEAADARGRLRRMRLETGGGSMATFGQNPEFSLDLGRIIPDT